MSMVRGIKLYEHLRIGMELGVDVGLNAYASEKRREINWVLTTGDTCEMAPVGVGW